MMRKIKTNTKTIAIATAAVTTLSLATAAFVAIKKSAKAGIANGISKRDENFKFITVLDGLVENGTITEAQKDVIQSTISQAQEDALQTTITWAQEDALQSTITQDQEDALQSTITQDQEVTLQSTIKTGKEVDAAKGEVKKGTKGGFKTVTPATDQTTVVLEKPVATPAATTII